MRGRRVVDMHTEDGSVLPLIFAFAGIAGLLLAVVATASALFLAERRLSAAADGAAVSAADSMDLAPYYRNRERRRDIQLDPELVQAAVEEYRRHEETRGSFASIDMAPELNADRTVVTVNATATIQLPLGWLVPGHPDGRFDVRARASARSPLIDSTPAG